MFDLESYLREKCALVDKLLNDKLPPENTRPNVLHRAMRYSVLSGGKRLRPILCIAAAESVKAAPDVALIPGCAIELLHTYTLVHDDLPSMDNDSLRRGQPTTHVAFGEANAILAGDALLTLAFEWLAECQAPAPYHPNTLSLELAKAAGHAGVVGGQVEDLAAEGTSPSPEMVEFIHRHKTADLFRAAARMGAIVGGARTSDLGALTTYGENLGLAFQIVDDILNATSTAKDLGKATGSDEKRKKTTYVSVFGLDKAQSKARELITLAKQSLRSLPGSTTPLSELATYTLERSR